MLKPGLEKIDEIDTPIGSASVLRYGRQRLLSFPSHIDSTSKVAMQTYYSTLQWPHNVELQYIDEFLPGPALPGHLMLAMEQVFIPTEKAAHRMSTKGPRHIRKFIGNVLAELAATLIAGQ